MGYRTLITILLLNLTTTLSCGEIQLKTSHHWIRFVDFITPQELIIAGDKGCAIRTIDGLSTKNISDGAVYDISLSFDRKKIAIIEPHKKVVYDISNSTIKKLLSIPMEQQIAEKIALGNDALFMYSFLDDSVTSYDHNYGKSHEHELNWSIPLTKSMSYNSQRNELCLVGNYGYIKTLQLRESKLIKKNLFIYPFTTGYMIISKQAVSCTYSHDESMIAVNITDLGYYFHDADNLNILFRIYNPNNPYYNLEQRSLLAHNRDKCGYITIAFHPNNTLAALLTNKYAIEFWDYKKQSLLKTISLYPDKKEIRNIDFFGNVLSFSPGGLQIIAASKTKVYIKNIIDCLYEPNTIQCYWLINLFKNYELPQDVINLIKNKLMETYAWTNNQKKSNHTLSSHHQESPEHNSKKRFDKSLSFRQQLQKKWQSLSTTKKYAAYCSTALLLASIIVAIYGKITH